jgi:2-iminobutanoate/2-iminopropanoate deaminase
MRCVLLLVFAVVAFAATLKPIVPKDGPKPIGPYNPGIDAGDFVYVSGQGARDATGQMPSGIEDQTRQCLANVKAVLDAAGLTPEHVVWAQVFLTDVKSFGAMNRAYGAFFIKDPPARSTIAVARTPGETPVEIAVVAVRDLKQKKSISDAPARIPVSNAVQVGDRVYLSGILGIDAKSTVPKDPRQQVRELITQMRSALGKTGLELRNMAYVRVYVDSAIPLKLLGQLLTEVLPSEAALSVIETAALPMGAHIEISGVASKNAKREGDCTSIGDTVYCPGAGGTIEQALKRISANMTNARTNAGRVVATNVFLDDIQNFEAMNKVYAGTFGRSGPARVTVQPTQKADELTLAPSTNSPPPKRDSPRVQITTVAVR